MGMYNAVPPPPEEILPIRMASSPMAARQTPPPPRGTTSGIDIDAWTVSALQALSVSPVARGIGSPLHIPIDQHDKPTTVVRAVSFKEKGDNGEELAIKRPPSTRDSMKRREALLKGNEGSRQRRRWENDRLIGVPNAQPPQPGDWEVRPTHRIHHVPYQLAHFWDRGVRQNMEDKTARLQAQRKAQQLKKGSATGLGIGEVPRDLRETAKRSPTVRGWVRDLEEPVRRYLRAAATAATGGAAASQQARRREEDSVFGSPRKSDDEDGEFDAEEHMDSEDEEIVFVGRKGAMRELRAKKNQTAGAWRKAHREVESRTVDSGMVFDSFGDDESAAFKRWLTHSISDYYGLESRSVSLTNPARRVVYVGFKQVKRSAPAMHLPRPLWEICSS